MTVSISKAREAIEVSKRIEKLVALQNNLKKVTKISSLDRAEFRADAFRSKTEDDAAPPLAASVELYDVSFAHFGSLVGVQVKEWLLALMVEKVEFAIVDARSRLKALGFSE